jgi:hypothetical protein
MHEALYRVCTCRVQGKGQQGAAAAAAAAGASSTLHGTTQQQGMVVRCNATSQDLPHEIFALQHMTIC